MQTGHLARAVLCVAGFAGCAAPLGDAAAAKRHMLSLCTEPNFRGKCEDIGKGLPALPPRFAGKFRSIKPI